MGLAENQLPPAPRCTRWCAVHDGGTTWRVDRAATTKTCRRTVTVSEGDEEAVDIHIARFAGLEEGRIVLAAPSIETECAGPLSVALAQALADTLQRVTELIDAPHVAA
jgi:hypothetical protein